MAISPLKGAINNVSVVIKIDGTPIDDSVNILSIRVDKQVNQIATAEVQLALPIGTGDDKTFLLTEKELYVPGRLIEIAIGYHSNEETVFEGLIVAQSIRGRANRESTILIKCSHKAIQLTMGRKSAYFKDKKDSDILSNIISNAGVAGEVEDTSYQHKQLVQYQSVDWDFILSRAEANGLIVYTEKDKIFVKRPLSSGTGELILTYGKDVLAFDGSLDSRFQMSNVTSKSWDMKTQDLIEGQSQDPVLSALGNLNGDKMGADISLGAADWQVTSPLEQAELKDWADAQLLRARMAAKRGTITFIGNAKPALNTLIELAGFGKRYNGEALITRVTHELAEGNWETSISYGLSPEMYYQQREINTPPAGGLLPSTQGLVNGIVKKIDADPDGEHRIQVDVPVIAKSGDGIWARLSNFYSTTSKGIFFMPEIGDEVVLGFLNNDPRHPIILGSLYSTKITPPYTADPGNKIKAIVTKNDLKIEFDDDQKILTIETPGGNRFILSDKDKSITIEDQNGNKMVTDDKGILIDSAKDITLKAAGKIDITASQNINTKSSGGDVALQGLNVKAKAQVAFSAEGSASAELKASGQTTVKGAMVMIN